MPRFTLLTVLPMTIGLLPLGASGAEELTAPEVQLIAPKSPQPLVPTAPGMEAARERPT